MVAKGSRDDQKDPIFPEGLLNELDEILRDEPARVPPKPAPLVSSRPAAAPAPIPPPQLPGNPENRCQAQELGAQARLLQPVDLKKALKLAREALHLDRHCVDALVILAHAKATSPDELAELLDTVIERGERGFGKPYLDFHQGRLFARPEAWPLIRARRELADLLRDLGRTMKAIEHYEVLLELDEADHVRVRDPLVGCYLAMEHFESARQLLDQFSGDTSATLAWSRAMERFLAGDMAGASEALGTARRNNSWVEDYVLGKKPMPQYASSRHTKGGEEEARYCMANLLPALVQHTRFSSWLTRQG